MAALHTKRWINFSKMHPANAVRESIMSGMSRFQISFWAGWDPRWGGSSNFPPIFLQNCNGNFICYPHPHVLLTLHDRNSRVVTKQRALCSGLHTLEERKSMEFNFQFPFECETLISFLQARTRAGTVNAWYMCCAWEYISTCKNRKLIKSLRIFQFSVLLLSSARSLALAVTFSRAALRFGWEI